MSMLRRIRWNLHRWWVKFLSLLLRIAKWFEARIESDLKPVTRFTIQQHHTGARHMSQSQASLIGVKQGATGTFTATPLDSNGNATALPAGIVPVWVSSDPTNAPIVATADGLGATVTVPTTATVGATVTISISATLADGTVPTSGEVALPILATTAVLPVASFIITQAS